MNYRLEQAKNLLCKPVTAFVMILLIVVSIVSYAVFSTLSQSYYEQVSKLNITEISKDSNGNLKVTLEDYKESQESDYKEAQDNLSKLSNPEKEITDILDSYIEKRYNYSGNAKDNLTKVLSEVKDLSTSAFFEQVQKNLTETSVTGESKAVVVKRYCSSIDVKDAESFTDEMIYLYAVKINDKYYAIEYNMKSVGGAWKVNKETNHGIVEGGLFNA